MTVGSGFAPDLLTPRVAKNEHARALAGSQLAVVDDALHTAGGEFHPALKTH
jgi:hypothetical protein